MLAPWAVIVTTGCIDPDGHGIEGDAHAITYGTVWIRKTELEKAQCWGWQASGLESGELMVVSRYSNKKPASGPPRRR